MLGSAMLTIESSNTSISCAVAITSSGTTPPREPVTVATSSPHRPGWICTPTTYPQGVFRNAL